MSGTLNNSFISTTAEPGAYPGADAPVILRVENLSVGFGGPQGLYKAVDGLSFTLNQGETFCLVGESGCGKSVTALSLLRLLPGGRILSGRALFAGATPGLASDNASSAKPNFLQDLLSLTEKELDKIRGAQIAMVFQEPMTALNPVLRVGHQVAEPLLLHGVCGRREARARAVELLRVVGIPEPEARSDDFPHQMSGGMRQRVMIAAAMACRPRLLIADEPTTALDVSLQGQILYLMRDLVREVEGSLLLITHDLAVVEECADRLAVMYAGKIVEYGPAEAVLENPLHPYTVGLIQSRPRLEAGGRALRLPSIAGVVPPPWARPPGCAFSTRCPKVFAPCHSIMPELCVIENGRSCRCHLWADPYIGCEA